MMLSPVPGVYLPTYAHYKIYRFRPLSDCDGLHPMGAGMRNPWEAQPAPPLTFVNAAARFYLFNQQRAKFGVCLVCARK